MTIDSAPSRELPAGLSGYTLVRPLEAGGMAEVFAATQESLGRQVAVKVMKAGDAELAERFLREARLVATLNHPNIVHIYDVGRLADGRPYLSMELLPGGDLRHRLRTGLADAEVRRIMRQLAEGLQAVHAHGIVHRDIKPANILFRANGDAVLTDFGIAKATAVDSDLTQAGMVVGSPAYSSPEQVRLQPLDGRSDLYSLGVVLAEMLTGRNPFRGEDYAATVVRQLQLPPPRLPAAQAAWQPVLERLLAKAPDARFADVAALLAALPAEASAAVTTAPGRAVAATAPDGDATVIAAPPVAPAAARALASSLAAAVATLGARLAPLQQIARDLWSRPVARRGGIVLLALLLAAWGWRWWQRDPQVAQWLELAETRVEQDRLATPEGDSALFYYQLVLARDPANAEARDGLAEVAERFAGLARGAREAGELGRAQDYVARGLEARPEDPDLLALREEIREAKRAQRRGGVKRFLDNLLGG